MRKSFFLSAIALILSASFAFGEDKPWEKDFKGVPFGASEKVAIEKIPTLDCMDFRKSKRISTDPFFAIGDAYAVNELIFEKDKLIGIIIKFKAGFYGYIKDAFIKKYGSPTVTEDKTIRTKGGVEYTNEILKWEGIRISLALQKFPGSLDTGSSLYLGESTLKEKVK